jgi:hypothetical protein
MAKDNARRQEDWVEALDRAGRSIAAAVKRAHDLPEDPFKRRHEVEAIRNSLSDHSLGNLGPPQRVLDDLTGECAQLAAEFWQRFGEGCSALGWELHGSTSRRMLCRGIIVELKGESVTVEGIAEAHSPHVPALVESLKPEVAMVAPDAFDAAGFMSQLVTCYDRLPGSGAERGLEDVYRTLLWIVQKPAFWRSLDPKQFVRFTRPMFRARLTEALRQGLKSGDGRVVQLGTTTQPRDAWEVFSPGEGRVVQVGRLGLVRLAED